MHIFNSFATTLLKIDGFPSMEKVAKQNIQFSANFF